VRRPHSNPPVLHNALAVSSPHLFPYAPLRKKERRELLNLQSAASRSAPRELAQAETEWQLKVTRAPTTCPTAMARQRPAHAQSHQEERHFTAD
jgi:hypothetical protein